MIGRFLLISAFAVFAFIGLAMLIFTSAWSIKEFILWLL